MKTVFIVCENVGSFSELSLKVSTCKYIIKTVYTLFVEVAL